jgi:hypothetical protein
MSFTFHLRHLKEQAKIKERERETYRRFASSSVDFRKGNTLGLGDVRMTYLEFVSFEKNEFNKDGKET